MKAQLKKRPESRRIRTESGGGNRKANAVLAEEYFRKAKGEQLAANYDRAIELYMLAVTCKPNYFQAFCNLGYCYRAMGRFGEAKRSYQSALFSNPADPISHYNLANLYRVMGENELAIEEYTQVIGLKQAGSSVGSLYIDSLVNIGICFKNKGEIEEAIKVNRRVLEEEPGEPSATFNLAMCVLNSIEAKNSPLFHKFYHQRATEAHALFTRILATTPHSTMAQFCLAKVEVLLDQSPSSLEAAIARLKELLTDPKCDIKDEIGQEIGRYLSLLKKFDESARYYQDSVGGMARRSRTASQVENIFETFSQQKISQQEQTASEFLTEAEGISLIESGYFKKAQERISQLEQGLLKHTLQLALEVKISEEDTDNIDNAIAVYNQHFNKSQTELPFSKISLEGHKAIGKLFSLQKDYEASIRHYEFISQNIKNDRNFNSAKLHSQLGEGYEQAGNRQKALEEYKKGIEIEPDNYSLSYSMAYCLYENGSLEEAKATFDRIIQRIRADNSLPAATRELYETDCLIISALSTTQHSAATFELFTQAFQKLQKLQASRDGALEMEEENLLLFYIRVSELYEEKISEILPDDPLFSQWAQTLISVYQGFLELACCPDRDEILANSGNLSYQLGLYATAAETYLQITEPRLFPAINVALAFAHLIEPVLALKYAQQACQAEPKETLNAFCLEVLQWMYVGARDGHWSKHLPAFKQDLFYLRQEYGVGLLDKLSEAINAPDYLPKNKEKLLESLARHQERIKSRNSLINNKFQHIEELRVRYGLSSHGTQTGILSPEVLKLCFSKSNQVVRDLERLTELLEKMAASGRESEFIEAAIYLFVYYNQIDSQPILEAIRRLSNRKKQFASITPHHPAATPQFCSIYPDFTTAKEAINVLKEWESVLEPATRSTLRVIEDAYYQSKIVQPLEAEYHFPRHCNLLEQDETFEKLISIVLRVLKYDKKLICKGANVQELRIDLIREFETHFKRFLKETTLHPINLSDSFLPLTLYATLETKQECQQFLNAVCKRLNAPEVLIQECDEVVAVVDRTVRVRCRWNNPYQISSILQEVMDSLTDNPLFIVNQAILYLQAAIPIIRADSEEARKYISLDSTLNF